MDATISAEAREVLRCAVDHGGELTILRGRHRSTLWFDCLPPSDLWSKIAADEEAYVRAVVEELAGRGCVDLKRTTEANFITEINYEVSHFGRNLVAGLR